MREEVNRPSKRLKVDDLIYQLQDIEFDHAKESINDEDEGLGFQIARGLFLPIKLDHHALVLSQGWPSWSFALEGLGFSSISTVASFPSLTSRDEFRCT